MTPTKATRPSIARTRHAHVLDLTYHCCCATALYVALCCPHDVWCLSSVVWAKSPDTKYVHCNVRMSWYINYSRKGAYFTAQIGAIYVHAMDVSTQRQHIRNMGYGGVTNGTLQSKQSATTTATRASSCWLLLLGAGLLLGGRIIYWCSV